MRGSRREQEGCQTDLPSIGVTTDHRGGAHRGTRRERPHGRVRGARRSAEVVGLVWSGHDAKMVGYAAMTLACAAVLWWPMRRG